MSSEADRSASLERSLQRTFGSLVLVVLVVISLAGGWIGRRAMEQFVASRLEHDAEAIMASLDPETGHIGRSLPPVYSQPLSGHYFVIQGTGFDTIRSRSLWDADLPPTELEPDSMEPEVVDGPRGQTLFVWRSEYERHGKEVSVIVAEDISPLVDALQRFLLSALTAAMIASMLLYLFQKQILRRAFRQIDAVREDVQRLSFGESGRLREDVPVEVRPLVTEFNSLISAWQGHIKRSRNAMGNLAHALKSPLQILLQRGTDDGDTTVMDQAERMRQIVERELRQVRLAGTAAGGRRFEPGTDIPELVESLKSLYRDKSLNVTAEISLSGYLPFDQEDMLELLGNLLDNAAKWANGHVLLTAGPGNAGFIRIMVADDGPGVDPLVTKSLRTRGSRFDESRPGHGLGLAIVGDIVDLYDGRLDFDRSARLGGFSVTVELPVRASPTAPGRLGSAANEQPANGVIREIANFQGKRSDTRQEHF